MKIFEHSFIVLENISFEQFFSLNVFLVLSNILLIIKIINTHIVQDKCMLGQLRRCVCVRVRVYGCAHARIYTHDPCHIQRRTHPPTHTHLVGHRGGFARRQRVLEASGNLCTCVCGWVGGVRVWRARARVGPCVSMRARVVELWARYY